MRKTKNSKIVILLCFFALFLTGCATTVGINMLIPAEVNIGGNTTIAVAGTTPYAHFDWDSKYVAKDASEMITKALSQGVYKVVGVKETDAIINAAKTLGQDPTKTLLSKGVDILVQSSVEAMRTYDTYDESLVKGSDGKYHRHIEVETHAELALTLIVWDLRTQRIIDVVKIADRFDNGKKSDNVSYMYSVILDGFKNKIRNRLVPHYENIYISLLPNKPKNEILEPAYGYVRNGDLNTALRIFENNWNSTATLVSGYNTAVLYYAAGNQSKAVEFAKSVYERTGNEQVFELIARMSSLIEAQETAKSQITGKDQTSVGGGIVY